MTELTAYRTLALRDALSLDRDVAFLAALHALCLKLFYRSSESCLDIDVKSVVCGSQTPGLNAMTKAVDERHRRWSEQLPRGVGELWDTLSAFDPDSRDALFAHCVALSANAVHEPWNRRTHALAHADRIVEAIRLDIAAAGWSPTVDNYLGRVTKAHILQAVREARAKRPPAHRASEEGRDGGAGAGTAHRFRVVAGAHAWPEDRRNIFELRIQPDLTGQFSRRGIGGDRMRNGHCRF